tara:strand:- start:4018 stop:4437 length:420 start_codon:yes stop_codon:yes gene_type:complete
MEKNERAYYRQRAILSGLRKGIVEHPRFKSKAEYVRVRKSQKGNHYLSFYLEKRMRVASVTWFSGSKDPKRFRGFRLFYPFGSDSQLKRDFRIEYQPEKSSSLILGQAVAKVVDYLLSDECFTEAEDIKITYVTPLNAG